MPSKAMLIVVFGLRGPLVEWCVDLATRLTAGGSDAPARVVGDSIRDLLLSLLTVRSGVVLASSRPDPGLVDIMTQAKVKYLYAGEDAKRSAAYRMSAFGEDHLSAVRHVLADHAALQGLAEGPDCLYVTAAAVLADPKAAVASIASHLGLRVDVDTVAGRIVAEATDPAMPAVTPFLSPGAAPAGSAPEPQRLSTLRSNDFDEVLDKVDSQADRQRLVLDAALNGLGNPESPEEARRIVITRDFFNLPEAGVGAVGSIDATGRPRLLVFGPYVCLPAGEWTARCVHGYSSELAGNSFSIDVYSSDLSEGQQLARSSFKIPPAGGPFETLLQFTIADVRAPIEVRLFADRAVFSGEITLGFVEFSRRGAATLDVV